MIHISLRNKARHTRTREPGSVVIILMKIPHVRASFDSFHPGKMFVTHFSHRKRSNAVLPGVQKGRVGKKKKKEAEPEERREERTPSSTWIPCLAPYTQTCTIYITILLQEFQTTLRRSRDHIRIFIRPYNRKIRSQDSTSCNACCLTARIHTHPDTQ